MTLTNKSAIFHKNCFPVHTKKSALGMQIFGLPPSGRRVLSCVILSHRARKHRSKRNIVQRV